MKAKVLREFKGCSDGDVYPKLHKVGAIITGNLAKAAIEDGSAVQLGVDGQPLAPGDDTLQGDQAGSQGDDTLQGDQAGSQADDTPQGDQAGSQQPADGEGKQDAGGNTSQSTADSAAAKPSGRNKRGGNK